MTFDQWFPSLKMFSFSYRDLIGQDLWEARSLAATEYSFVTATNLTLTIRFRVIGRKCEFQVKSTGTSLDTLAGTSYIALPISAQGLGGMGVMTNDTTNVAVGVGHIDVATSRFYPPTQAASGNDFTFAGWYEV